ncbi:DUF4097 family beta strand repeat-containing protein [Calidifontibacter terrae]
MRVEKLEPIERADLSVMKRSPGALTVTAADTDAPIITIEGDGEELVEVRQDGPRISIEEPERHHFGRSWDDRGVRIEVVVPTASDVSVMSGSSEVTVAGEVGDLEVKSGSGRLRIEHVRGRALLDRGSGDTSVDRIGAGARMRSGSGSTEVGELHGDVQFATGSGGISIESFEGNLTSKSGSGDVRIAAARGDIRAASGSGSVEVDAFSNGSLDARTGSGSVAVRVPAGTPVWTDIVSGRPVENSLPSVGAPTEGQDHVRLRARTGSGRISLSPSA